MNSMTGKFVGVVVVSPVLGKQADGKGLAVTAAVGIGTLSTAGVDSDTAGSDKTGIWLAVAVSVSVCVCVATERLIS